MTRIVPRNYAMVAHISGSRGAGAHESAHNFYKRARDQHIADAEYLTEEEMRQEVIRILVMRESAGLRVHFLSNFAYIGRRSDLLSCLDCLTQEGRIWRVKKLSCAECGSQIVTKSLMQNSECLFCNRGMLCFVSEFFAS